MGSYSTEITSSKIVSDNPLYQRTKKAYTLLYNKNLGDTLEIGCGEGYGVEIYKSKVKKLYLIDKSAGNLETIKQKNPDCSILKSKVPPLINIPNESFDTVISFQVIEHIKDYDYFLREIHRVLKSGGTAYISTPNKEKTIVKNPWHFKEFNYQELVESIEPIFNDYSISGIEGNSKTEKYYNKSNQRVAQIISIDIFNLINVLPNVLLRIPYEILNRVNRLLLLKKNDSLINSISTEDYVLKPYNSKTLDFFCELKK